MNKEEALKLSEILKAYAEGKTIQWRIRSNYRQGEQWYDCFNPTFDFANLEYRIKPEPKLRPYANAEEFLAAQKEHGPYFKYKEGNQNWFLPDIINDAGCHIGVRKWEDDRDKSISYSWICDHFIWQDGAHCGILEE